MATNHLPSLLCVEEHTRRLLSILRLARRTWSRTLYGCLGLGSTGQYSARRVASLGDRWQCLGEVGGRWSPSRVGAHSGFPIPANLTLQLRKSPPINLFLNRLDGSLELWASRASLAWSRYMLLGLARRFCDSTCCSVVFEQWLGNSQESDSAELLAKFVYVVWNKSCEKQVSVRDQYSHSLHLSTRFLFEIDRATHPTPFQALLAQLVRASY
ncbi:hypothetical protein QBC47DRAFT_72848 [Echria macrotheca]|uniref:Uncharacterized protein n=1 Tax=Echria macrotheca TaxID=438768 RepID=A0AAJ0B7J9_9PEZI|nr:hypothetical protein QBC47DRAFT_72848 [Echria macrotheca]